MYRINKLLKSDRKLFHTQDLGVLWGINNKNSLYTAIKRDIDKGILIPIHKGFYSAISLEKINPLILGIGYLHQFAYVSCETILFRKGIIFQQSGYYTLVSGRSLKFMINQSNFLVRKLHNRYLFNDFEVVENNGVLNASLERAVADILYYNPDYYFDNRKKIDWAKVKEIQKEVYSI